MANNVGLYTESTMIDNFMEVIRVQKGHMNATNEEKARIQRRLEKVLGIKIIGPETLVIEKTSKEYLTTLHYLITSHFQWVIDGILGIKLGNIRYVCYTGKYKRYEIELNGLDSILKMEGLK